MTLLIYTQLVLICFLLVQAWLHKLQIEEGHGINHQSAGAFKLFVTALLSMIFLSGAMPFFWIGVNRLISYWLLLLFESWLFFDIFLNVLRNKKWYYIDITYDDDPALLDVLFKGNWKLMLLVKLVGISLCVYWLSYYL